MALSLRIHLWCGRYARRVLPVRKRGNGLLYVLSVAIFAAIGYICAFILLTIRSIDEGEEILRYRIEMLEEKVEELEREQLIAKGAKFVD